MSGIRLRVIPHLFFSSPVPFGLRAASARPGAGRDHRPIFQVSWQLVREGGTGESAGELARTLGIPPQTLSFHLKEMTHAGLLRARREGRHIYYVVDFDHARRLVAYLSDSCCADEDWQREGGQHHG